MKITIYELLGMIKNNKNLPKKIKYGNDVYVLQENPKDYATWLNDNLDLLNDVILGHFNVEDAIYLELEIIEEKRIPEKLGLYEETQNIIRENNYKLVYHDIHKCIVSLECKYNQLIDYLKSKGE